MKQDDSKLAQQNDDVIRPDKNPSEAGSKKSGQGKKFWPQSFFPSITLTTFWPSFLFKVKRRMFFNIY